MFSIPARQKNVKRSAFRFHPRLEGLEDRAVLSTFKVNTTLDTVAVSLKTGKDASGHISLRSAVMAADAHGGKNTIVLPSGTFALTIASDLEITRSLTINGKGASTIVDGNNLARVFEVMAGNVSISKLTIEGGLAAGEGGGILNNAGARLALTSVQVANNVAAGAAGTAGLNGTGGTPARREARGETASEGGSSTRVPSFSIRARSRAIRRKVVPAALEGRGVCRGVAGTRRWGRRRGPGGQWCRGAPADPAPAVGSSTRPARA